MIQTYQPDHYSIVHAAAQDYEGFYEEEIAYRELMEYPPVQHMLAVLVISREREEGESLAGQMAQLIRERGEETLHVVGPAEASIAKLQDLYRYIFYIRHREYQVLVEIKDILEQYCKEQELRSQTVQFDFDPMNCY